MRGILSLQIMTPMGLLMGVSPAQAGIPSVLPAQAGAPVDELSEETAEEDVIRGPKPPRTLAEALSQRHMMTHLPKNTFCDVCSKAKMQRRQKRKKAPILDPLVDALPPPKNFGDQVTGDHLTKKGGGDFDEAEDPNFLATLLR